MTHYTRCHRVHDPDYVSWQGDPPECQQKDYHSAPPDRNGAPYSRMRS